MNRTPFHGSSLDVELDNGFPPGEATFWRKSDERDAGLHHMHHFQEEMDDPSSNCRIIVDDLDERLQDSEILNKFKSYGAVETFDIQRERGRLSAIIRFRSLSSAVRARREMNGQPFGDRRCRVDYRFADPTCELWVGGVHISVTEADVNREFSRFGRLCKVQINRANKCAFVSFDRVEDAVQAAANMRGRVLGSAAWKLKVDFADRSMGRSHSPGQFARFPKAAQMRVGSAEAVPAQPPPAHQAAAAPPQVTVQQTPAQQVTGPAQQATVQQVPAQQSVGQQIPADQIQNDVSDSGKEMEINVRAQSQTEQNSDSVPSSDSPANKKAVAGDGDAASNAANVTAGMKRREPEVARAEGMHPEKKALSIVVESSSSSSEASSKTNGHCSFDCLTARPGAGGDADASPRLEEHAEPQRDAAEEGATSDPLERFPELWRGLAVVKGSAAGVILRSVKCEDRLAKDMLVGERVTMTQRMRLGEEQMKEFGNRLQSTGEASRGVLLAVPASAEDGPLLRQLFVSYLLERNAAGVARLDTGMLYLFPPGSELASEYQKSAAIDLSHHPDYLLVILLQDL
jgi:RNA recognition motif-containing protein